MLHCRGIKECVESLGMFSGGDGVLMGFYRYETLPVGHGLIIRPCLALGIEMHWKSFASLSASSFPKVLLWALIQLKVMCGLFIKSACILCIIVSLICVF